jgi:hypothetical protein
MRTLGHRKWFFAPLALVAIIGFGLLTMVLWNALLPELLHLPTITFWQAIGLLVLARLLFGFHGRHFGGPAYHWRNRIREKWMNMTPEEREKFRQHLREHGHGWGYHCEDYKSEAGSETKTV